MLFDNLKYPFLTYVNQNVTSKRNKIPNVTRGPFVTHNMLHVQKVLQDLNFKFYVFPFHLVTKLSINI